MIEKLFPRLLNNSSDSRVRKGTEMSDALNVQVGGESEGSQTTGDLGVLKPINGNTVVGDYVFPSSSSKRVIGKAEDGQQNRVYFFVYSSNANEQGVYVYDNATATVDEVFTHPQFNFQPNGFVKGDVIHLNNQTDVDADERTLLYFTDNVNEPRKLDVERVQQLNVGPYNQYDFADLITACPRTPIPPLRLFSLTTLTLRSTTSRGLTGFSSRIRTSTTVARRVRCLPTATSPSPRATSTRATSRCLASTLTTYAPSPSLSMGTPRRLRRSGSLLGTGTVGTSTSSTTSLLTSLRIRRTSSATRR